MPNVIGECQSSKSCNRVVQRPGSACRARMRGAVSPKALIAIAVVIVAAVAAWWYLSRGGGTALTLPTPGANAPVHFPGAAFLVAALFGLFAIAMLRRLPRATRPSDADAADQMPPSVTV